MNKLKYEIPMILFFVVVLLSCGEINHATVRLCAWGISLVGAVLLTFFVIVDLEKMWKENADKKEETIKELLTNLSGAIEKYNDGQGAKLEQLMLLVDKLQDITGEYSKKVDALADIQAEIVNEQHICSKSNEKIYETIMKHYDEEDELFSSAIEEFGKTGEKNAEALQRIVNDGFEKISNLQREIGKNVDLKLEDFVDGYDEITERAARKEEINFEKFQTMMQTFLTEYGNVINESNDTIKTLNVVVTKSLEDMRNKMREQASTINEGLEDCSEAIECGLNDFSKKQQDRDDKQNEALKESINSIETVISEHVGAVLAENEKLMSYIQKIQEEWTTLNREEIDFLSKVWNE